MPKNEKKTVYEKVKYIVDNLEKDTFLVYDIHKINKLNHPTNKKYLNAMVSFGELKYDEASKMYMRIKK